MSASDTTLNFSGYMLQNLKGRKNILDNEVNRLEHPWNYFVWLDRPGHALW